MRSSHRPVPEYDYSQSNGFPLSAAVRTFAAWLARRQENIFKHVLAALSGRRPREQEKVTAPKADRNQWQNSSRAVVVPCWNQP